MTTTIRRRLALGVSAAVTLIWCGFVVAADLVDRVLDNWAAGATMLVGSFLAGSSPEGGGAVAFPVFTKGLDVPAAVARSFGLLIQAVGMSVASIAILLHRRPVHSRAVVIGSAGGVVGLLAGLFVWADPESLWWASDVSVPWVKATFSIVLATASILFVRRLRRPDPVAPLRWGPRADVLVAAVAFAGGVLSSMTGTGANIVVFLLLVVVIDVDPKRALPTVVIVMAVVSVVGAGLLGLADGQLDVAVSGERVTSVGGVATDLDAGRADLLGLWLAAVPVVAWGAPLGSWAAAKVQEWQLIAFVALLATIEVATTFILVDELRTERALVLYLVGGVVALPALLTLGRRHRARLLESSA